MDQNVEYSDSAVAEALELGTCRDHFCTVRTKNGSSHRIKGGDLRGAQAFKAR